jgi:hypothetical protein
VRPRVSIAATVGAVLLSGGAMTAVASASPPKIFTVASGLNAPKHLLLRNHNLYVVESGTGGAPGASNCVTGPATEGSGTTQYCEGATGAVAVVHDGAVSVVDGGLPSVIEEDTGEVAGPSGVAFGSGGRMHLTFQDELVNADGSSAVTGLAAREFGTLQTGPFDSVDLAQFAAANPQNPATLGGIPGTETTYDSDPYDVTSYRDGEAVVDAAANSLLYVSRSGNIQLLARFPTEPEQLPGPNPLTVDAQAVPTSVAVGPDGALYVGILRGVPSAPGTAQIYRVVPGQAPTVWARGLTAVTAIAFDPEGQLFATELSTGGLLAPPTVPGALVRVSRSGNHVTTVPVGGLSDPTGVAVAANGTIYVTNNGESAGTAADPGEILKIEGVK